MTEIMQAGEAAADLSYGLHGDIIVDMTKFSIPWNQRVIQNDSICGSLFFRPLVQPQHNPIFRVRG